MANSKNRRPFRISMPESLESRRLLTTVVGTVYEDLNGDTFVDPAEPRIPGAIVYIDANNNGLLDQRGFGIDPDEFSSNQVLNNVRQTVFPSATGNDNVPAFRVIARDEISRASTGQRVFGLEDTSDWGNGRRLRFDFTLPVDSVSLDVVGTSGISNPNVRLDAFNASGRLIDSTSINSLANGAFDELSLVRPQKDITSVVAYVTTVIGTVKFDNLRADDGPTSEKATYTADNGFYRFQGLPTGLTNVAQIVPDGYDQTTPEGSHQVVLTNGLRTLDFSIQTATIGGRVFQDLGVIGLYEPTVDRGISGVGVYLDANVNGAPDSLPSNINPNDFLDNQVLDFISRSVSLATVDADNVASGARVVAAKDAAVSPAERVFTHEGDAAWSKDVRLRAEFDSLASSVTLVATGGSLDAQRGRMVAYSLAGDEIASVSTPPLARGQSLPLTINGDGFEISYVVAYGEDAEAGVVGAVRLTDLRASIISEPVTVSDSSGFYEFKPLSSGEYLVRTLPTDALTQSFPANAFQQVSLGVGGEEDEIDFGFRPDNLPPVAKNDFADGDEDTVFGVNVLMNDSDPDGEIDFQSVVITQQPLHGVAQVDGDGAITYTPNPDFHGRDTLLYTVQDDEGSISNVAVVTLQVDSVNDDPVAVDDSVSVLGTEVTPFNVLANDSDVDGTLIPSTVRITVSPTNGVAVVDPTTGVITYTPIRAGDDELIYTVEDNDGAVSNEATVSINRRIAGIPPVAVDDSTSTGEGSAVAVTVTDNDTDADGTINLNSVFIVSLPANGSVAFTGNGAVNYQPNLGFVGVDTFSYRVQDNEGLVSNSAVVSVTMSERDFPYQNPIDSLDVDGNGVVSPRDVLFIIREIDERNVSSAATGATNTRPTVGERPAAYVDVDGNGFVIGRDVLTVIRFLNDNASVSTAAAEPPELLDTDLTDIDLAAAVYASDFDALDDDESDDWFA